MAEESTEEQPQEPISVAANAAMTDEDDEDCEEIVDDEEYEEDDEEESLDDNNPLTPEAKLQHYGSMMEKLLDRLTTERVPLLVHQMLIKGNTRTTDSLIESQLAVLKSVSSAQELFQAAKLVNLRLRRLGIFDSVNLTIDSGPPELPGTANVVVEVVESRNLLSGDIGVFAKPEARSWSLDGSLKLKNLFGYGDLWDSSFAYGWDQSSEVSAGVYLPQFKRMIPPAMARISLLSQDWLKFSSYKKRALSLSLGLLSSENHDLSYSLSRSLTDPSQKSSGMVTRQLGHGLLSALKYTFKIDRRNSPLRPTCGYAFISTSQIGGILPDYRSLRFFRQEFDFRFALPLGFYGAALNFGVSAGVNFPWGSGYSNFPSYLPERFFMGGNTSPVCTLGGPMSVLGFKSKGLGTAESRRQVKENAKEESSAASSEMDHAVEGDLVVTAFADLSFDLPLKVFRDAGIHAHAFACTGSLNKLTENAYRDLPFQKFRESFRSSAGLGIIVPTKLFRMEVNYCYILKQLEHDQGKTGLQFSFSSPL